MNNNILMNLIPDYPSSSPEGSIYLPYTRRREVLSIVDRRVDDAITSIRQIANGYKAKDAFNTFVAKNIIQDVFSTIKQGRSILHYLNDKEKRRIFTHLNKLEEGFLVSLEEKGLVPVKEIFIKIENILSEWEELVYLENSANSKLPNFQLLPEDFHVAKHTNEEYERYVSSGGVPLCQDFAFYHVNEVNAFPFLFDSRCNWPLLATQFLSYLNQWGYERVQIATAGDLVVYCSTLENLFTIEHWGIWTTDGKVLSKKGIGPVCKHPIDDVLIGYGNFVYIFHKKVKSPLFQDFLQELEKAAAALNDFSHPAVASPLTTQGCMSKIIQIFTNKKIEKVFKNSLFNEEYTFRLKLHFFDEIYKLKQSSFVITASKIQVLNLIKQLIISTSEEVKVDI